MSKRISRRLFLGGATLLGAGIALDRLGRGEQVTTAEESDAGALTPTVVATQDTPSTAVPPTFTLSVPKKEIIAVEAGGYDSLAVTQSGEVVAWGRNLAGSTNVPVGLRDVVAVAAGEHHSLALPVMVRWWRGGGTGVVRRTCQMDCVTSCRWLQEIIIHSR